jgi:ABC-2 type transport system ATP-binding protein
VAIGADLAEAIRVLARHADGEPWVDAEARHVIVPADHGARRLADVVRDLDAAGVELEDLGVRRPTLDDVFLALTGRAVEDTGDGAPAGAEIQA